MPHEYLRLARRYECKADFMKWRRIIDGLAFGRFMCSLYDLPKMPLQEWYDAGYAASEVPALIHMEIERNKL